MLFAPLEHVPGDPILAVQGWCKQHDTGNVLEPAIRKLCFFSPAYCCAKRLRSNSFYQALLAGVKAELAEHLVWIRGSESLEWRPDPSVVQCSRSVLELAHHGRNLLFELGPGEDPDARLSRQKERGERCVRVFVGGAEGAHDRVLGQPICGGWVRII